MHSGTSEPFRFDVGRPCVAWPRGSLSEEREVALFADALDEQREFHGVVIAPQGGFAAGSLLTLGNVIPAVGAVIDAVQEQALMLGVSGEIGVGEERLRDGETGLVVAFAGLGFAVVLEPETEADEALRGDG